MKKKPPKPVKKERGKRSKKFAEKSSERSPEVQEEITIGREFMAQYEQTFKDLAKS
jgi:hypothetical protein